MSCVIVVGFVVYQALTCFAAENKGWSGASRLRMIIAQVGNEVFMHRRESVFGLARGFGHSRSQEVVVDSQAILENACDKQGNLYTSAIARSPWAAGKAGRVRFEAEAIGLAHPFLGDGVGKCFVHVFPPRDPVLASTEIGPRWCGRERGTLRKRRGCWGGGGREGRCGGNARPADQQSRCK